MSLRFYESVINQIILPSYGDVRLVDIRKSHLQVLIDYLATSRDAHADGKPFSLAVPTIKRYVSVFRSVMKEAHNQNFITDMINRSNLVICYIDHKSGGAYQSVKYAEKKKTRIKNLC